MPDLYLTPLTGALVVFVVVVSGHRFRKAWKDQDPGWHGRAWVFGLIALLGLMSLAFVPLNH